jgi:hypothetical protein
VETIYRSFKQRYSGTPSSPTKDEQMARELAALILVYFPLQPLLISFFVKAAASTDRRLPQGLYPSAMELASKPAQLRERLMALVPDCNELLYFLTPTPLPWFSPISTPLPPYS